MKNFHKETTIMKKPTIMISVSRIICAAIFGFSLVAGITAAEGTRRLFSIFSQVKAETSVPVLEQPAPENFPSEGGLVEHQAEMFDAAGMYYFEPEEIPHDFSDIQFLEIETREYFADGGTYTNKPIAPAGYIETNKPLRFSSISVGDREVSFQTFETEGVRYKFVGHFPVNSGSEYCDGCEYPPDLTGKLTKLKNGKIVAEMNAKFYLAGC